MYSIALHSPSCETHTKNLCTWWCCLWRESCC